MVRNSTLPKFFRAKRSEAEKEKGTKIGPAIKLISFSVGPYEESRRGNRVEAIAF